RCRDDSVAAQPVLRVPLVAERRRPRPCRASLDVLRRWCTRPVPLRPARPRHGDRDHGLRPRAARRHRCLGRAPGGPSRMSDTTATTATPAAAPNDPETSGPGAAAVGGATSTRRHRAALAAAYKALYVATGRWTAGVDE